VEPVTAAFAGLGDRSWVTSYDGSGNAVRDVAPGGVRAPAFSLIVIFSMI
jgi:hypothetical protein